MEGLAEAYSKKIQELGGMIPAIESGFFQREITDSAFRYQSELEKHTRILVGVNEFKVDDEQEPDILRIDRSKEEGQAERVRAVRMRRDAGRWSKAMTLLGKGCALSRQPDALHPRRRPRLRYRRARSWANWCRSGGPTPSRQ